MAFEILIDTTFRVLRICFMPIFDGDYLARLNNLFLFLLPSRLIALVYQGM